MLDIAYIFRNKKLYSLMWYILMKWFSILVICREGKMHGILASQLLCICLLFDVLVLS